MKKLISLFLVTLLAFPAYAGRDVAMRFPSGTPIQVVDPSGALSLTGIISPTTLSTTPNNNYNPTGLSTASVIRLTSSANVDITGLQGGTEGRIITIFNANTNNFYIDLRVENGLSTAANRFKFIDGYASTADCYLNPNQSVTLQYNGTLSRWLAFGSPVVFGPGFAVTSMPFTVSSYGALANTGAAMSFNQSSGLVSIQSALKVGTNLTVTDHIIAPLVIQPTNSTDKILILKGAASQTANPLELQYNTGTPFFSISSDGHIGSQANALSNVGINLSTGSTSTIGQIISGISGQTADLSEWKDSSGNILDLIDPTGNAGFGQSSLDTNYKVSINPDTLTVGDPSGASITVNYLTAPSSASGMIVDSTTGFYQMTGQSHTARFYNYFAVNGINTYDPNYSQSSTVTDTPTNYTIGDPTLVTGTINYGSGSYVANSNTLDLQVTSYWTPAGVKIYGSTQVFGTTGMDDGSTNPYNIQWNWTAPVGQTPDGYVVQIQENGGGYSYYQDVGNVTSFNDDGTRTAWTNSSYVYSPTSSPHNYYITWTVSAAASPTTGSILKIDDSTHGTYAVYGDLGTFITADDGNGADQITVNSTPSSWVTGTPESVAFYTANTNTHDIEVYSKRTTFSGDIFSSGNFDSGTVTTDSSLRAYYLVNSWTAGTSATGYRVLVTNNIFPYTFNYYHDNTGTSFSEANNSNPGWTLGNTVTPTSTLQGAFNVDAGVSNFADGANIVLGTSTGSKLATSASEKLGIWGVSPITQPSTTGTTTGFTAHTTANVVCNESTFTGNTGSKAYTISDIVKALKDSGIMASS